MVLKIGVILTEDMKTRLFKQRFRGTRNAGGIGRDGWSQKSEQEVFIDYVKEKSKGGPVWEGFDCLANVLGFIMKQRATTRSLVTRGSNP